MYLKREELIKCVDGDKILRKELTKEEILTVIKILTDKMNEYEFEEDPCYFMSDRKQGASQATINRLFMEEYNHQVVLDSLYDTWEVINDEDDSTFNEVAKATNRPVEEIEAMANEYRQKGIISIDEKRWIDVLLGAIRMYINNKG